MSDRTRSSVRTEPRDGSGTSDVPAAGPVDGVSDQAAAGTGASSTGATAAGSRGPASGGKSAPAPTEAEGAAAGRSAATKTPATKTPAAKSLAVSAPAVNAPGAKAPAVHAEAEPTARAAATPSEVAREAAPPAVPAPPAAHPVTPLAPAAPVTRTEAPVTRTAAPVTRTASDGPRPVTTPGPPVPPSPAGGRAVGGRTAAGAAPVDSTQAVPLPSAGARPADPASRPAAARSTAEPVRSAAETAGRTGKARGAGRGPRRARLQLRHIDTWSALKISLVLSIALFFVWMVAVGILYGVLSGLGVFTTLNDLIGQLSSSSGQDGGSGDVISAGIVFGGAAVIGAVNILLLTALCTVTAFVYNLCSDLVGGLEVTLAERD
jgi:hypothetical protein